MKFRHEHEATLYQYFTIVKKAYTQFVKTRHIYWWLQNVSQKYLHFTVKFFILSPIWCKGGDNLAWGFTVKRSCRRKDINQHSKNSFHWFYTCFSYNTFPYPLCLAAFLMGQLSCHPPIDFQAPFLFWIIHFLHKHT